MNLENFIISQFTNLKQALRYSAELNGPLCFDAGSFGEIFTCILKETKGCGTNGGGSFDTSTGDEVKTLMKMQSKNCNLCGWKNSFFSSSCHKCKSTDFKYANDTRAGIDAKSHFRYYDELGDYIIVEISPEVYDSSCRRFNIVATKIKKDNAFFNSMLKVQKDSGAYNKNLLTTSVEYLMSCPFKLFSCIVDISQNVRLEDVVYHKETEYEMIPKELFRRQYSGFRQKIVGESYDPLKNPLAILAIKGTQGKPRGKTKRTNIIVQGG